VAVAAAQRMMGGKNHAVEAEVGSSLAVQHIRHAALVRVVPEVLPHVHWAAVQGMPELDV
jgi:hypothetical protein